MTVKELATKLAEALETKKRINGDDFVSLRDGSPQWMTDVIRTVHGDKMPDDTTYAFIKRCAIAIADGDDDSHEAIYQIEPDVYTNDLTAWLHARVDHVYYLTEALQEFGAKDGFDALQTAQVTQIQEIGEALIGALQAAEESEEAEA